MKQRDDTNGRTDERTPKCYHVTFLNVYIDYSHVAVYVAELCKLTFGTNDFQLFSCCSLIKLSAVFLLWFVSPSRGPCVVYVVTWTSRLRLFCERFGTGDYLV